MNRNQIEVRVTVIGQEIDELMKARRQLLGQLELTCSKCKAIACIKDLDLIYINDQHHYDCLECGHRNNLVCRSDLTEDEVLRFRGSFRRWLYERDGQLMTAEELARAR